MSEIYRRWFNLGLDTWSLGIEASSVIGLRTRHALMGGDLDGREARLMVREKMDVARELQTAFFTGTLGADPATAAKKVVGAYTQKVRANRRRLS